MRRFFLLSCAIFALASTTVSAGKLKRRVLVLPFDNVQHEKNFSWMSDSIAENLKNNLLKSNRFEVLDVTLLRKIDPAMDFRNLTAENASAFAKRLNCEVAVVGRFTVTKTGKESVLTFEADGIDALETKQVVTKRSDSGADAALFDVVEKLTAEIADELTQKLSPLDADSFKRDNKLEKLIRRLEKPPTGFLDELVVETLKLEPEFDIDTFDYTIRLTYRDADRYPKFRLSYQYWGKRFEPGMVGSKDLKCAGDICTIAGPNPLLELTRTAGDRAVVYRVRIELPDPRGPIVARWWVTAGYPYLTSINALGQTNPAAIELGSPLDLGAMRGGAHLEAGFVPGRWQILPRGLRYALTLQAAYAQGEMAQYLADNPARVKIHLISLGGGMRIDRPFAITSSFELAPFLGVGLYYQRYFRDFGTNDLNTTAIAPEAGMNTFYKFGPSPWRFMATLAAGSFLYAGQNLTYIRACFGVEYIVR